MCQEGQCHSRGCPSDRRREDGESGEECQEETLNPVVTSLFLRVAVFACLEHMGMCLCFVLSTRHLVVDKGSLGCE